MAAQRNSGSDSDDGDQSLRIDADDAGAEPDWDALLAGHQDKDVDRETLRVMWLAFNKDEENTRRLLAGMRSKPAESPGGAQAKKKKSWSPFGSRKGSSVGGASKAISEAVSGGGQTLSKPEREALVQRKLMAMLPEGTPLNDQITELVRTLCDPRLLGNKFFNKDDCVAFVDAGMRSGAPCDANDSSGTASDGGETTLEARKQLTAFNQSDFEAFRALFPKLVEGRYVENGTMWRVKLMISSIRASSFEKKFSAVAGNPFGLVHTGLLVGPVVLEWGVESLVVPQLVEDYVKEHCVMLMDVDLNKGQASHFVSSDMLGELCATIVKWNGKNYNQLYANCQDFTTDCLRALEVDLGKETKANKNLKLFMKQISQGIASFDVKFTFEDKVFETHSELDLWVSENQDRLDVADRALIKAYDRAFWLRHLHYADDINDYDDEKQAKIDQRRKDARPLIEGCPFQDPRETPTMGPSQHKFTPGQVVGDAQSGSGPRSGARR